MGLGGNLGRPRAAFARALGRLAPHVTGLKVSSLWRTAPVGGPRQPDYINAAAIFRTRLPARALLALLQEIEREAGRVRSGRRNQPRTLDLDLLLHGSATIRERDLVVPHPRMAERRFVLAPLAEIAPRRVVPGTGRTVAALLALAPPARVARLRDARGWEASRGSASRSGAGRRRGSRASSAAPRR